MKHWESGIFFAFKDYITAFIKLVSVYALSWNLHYIIISSGFLLIYLSIKYTLFYVSHVQ